MNFSRWLLLVLVGALVGTGNCLAFIPNDGLIREERIVRVDVVSYGAEVRVRSVWRNVSNEDIVVQSWRPMVEGTVDVKLYVDLAGVGVHEFSDRLMLDSLADGAELWRNSKFFGMAAAPWVKLYRSYDFVIPAGESREVVWNYKYGVETRGDFSGVEVFLDDGVEDEFFQLEFSLVSDDLIRHFWSGWLWDGFGERGENSVVVVEQRENFLPDVDFLALWSGGENPGASFYYGGYDYRVHFASLSGVRSFGRISLVLDMSGSMSDTWGHVQELVRFLLENQLDKEVRVLLVGDDSAEWLVGGSDEFMENSSVIRQKILEGMGWRYPLGKADLSRALEMVGGMAEDHIVIVFSDGEEVSPVVDSAPVVVMGFNSRVYDSVWRRIASASRGAFLRAFRSVSGAKEGEDLLDSMRSLRVPINGDDIVLDEGEVDLSPEKLVPSSMVVSPVFVGRVKSEVIKNNGDSWFEWLPKRWGAARVADILERGEVERDFSTQDLDGMLAIGRTFGLRSDVFSEVTSREELLDNITATDDLWLVVEKMWNDWRGVGVDGVREMDGVPLWRNDEGVWRQYDFFDRVKDERWVKIAPFSAAQRQLFVLFPEIFAEVFGVGERVDFCSTFRCFSIEEGNRVEALPSDRAFLRDFDPYHWALRYVVDLVEADILRPEPNGKLHLDRAISRGEFVRMLVVDRYGEGFVRSEEGKEFTDLARGDEGYDAVQFLVFRGVVRGFGDGSFRPFQDLTRAEAVKILLALDDFSPYEIAADEVPAFSDSLGWERGWVEEAARRGIVKGYGNGLFGPGNRLTRAEASKVIVESR